MYKVALRAHRLIFVLAFAAGMFAVLFLPGAYHDKVVEVPAFALFTGEAGLALLLSLLFYENASTVQAITLAGSILGLSMLTGTVGNYVNQSTEMLPDAFILINWVQVIVMSATGLVTTLALFKLEPNEQMKGLMERSKQEISSTAFQSISEQDAITDASSATPSDLADFAPAAADPFGRSADAASQESHRDILEQLDVNRINQLERTLHPEELSLETLFAEESHAANAYKGGGDSQTFDPTLNPNSPADEGRMIELQGQTGAAPSPEAMSEIQAIYNEVNNPQPYQAAIESSAADTYKPDFEAQPAIVPPSPGADPLADISFDVPSAPAAEFSMPAASVEPAGQFAMPAASAEPAAEFSMPAAPAESAPQFAAPAAPAESAPQFAAPAAPAESAPQFAAPAAPAESAPQFAAPAAPAESAPQFAAPAAPAESAPQFAAPAAPAESAPQFAAPAAPAESAPQFAAPAAPAESAPQFAAPAAPAESAPQFAAPAAPAESAPQFAVPAAPAESAPQFAVPAAPAESAPQFAAPAASSESDVEPSLFGTPGAAIQPAAASMQDFAPPASSPSGPPPANADKPLLFKQDVGEELDSLFAEVVEEDQIASKYGPMTGAAPSPESPLLSQLNPPAAAESSAPAGGFGVAMPQAVETPKPAKAVIPQSAPTQEVKGFGRLSVDEAVQAPQQQLGTMRTIGKMLLDQQAVEKLIRGGEETFGAKLSTAKIITSSSGDLLNNFLKEIDANPTVNGSLLVGPDGMVMAATIGEGMESFTYGALSMSIFSHTNIASSKLSLGSLKELVLQSKDGLLVLKKVPRGTLVVFCDQQKPDDLGVLLDAVQLS